MVLHSRALAGIHALEVTVEVHLANGFPSFVIVGLLAHHGALFLDELPDRIDLHIKLPALKKDEQTKSSAGETSEVIRLHVEAAGRLQMERQNKPHIAKPLQYRRYDV